MNEANFCRTEAQKLVYRAQWEIHNSADNESEYGGCFTLQEAKGLVERRLAGLPRSKALAMFCRVQYAGGPVWRYERAARGLGWTWRKQK